MSESNVFDELSLPIGGWIKFAVESFADTWRPLFRTLRWPIMEMLNHIEAILISIHPIAFLLILFLVAWHISTIRIAAFSVCAMLFIGVMGVWEAAMTTIALVVTSVVFSVVLGFIIGVLAAKSDLFYAFVRPVVDVMQTLPAFVYLVPVVMLMGIGNVPAVIVTIVFALPPMIRLTNLGIREVPESIVEAAYAFGSTPRQVLFKIQIPLAVPAIMLAINQTIMMALAMVTFSAMIAAGGLGEIVLQGIGRLDMGLASIGGIGIVLLAMTLDRITQKIGQPRSDDVHWRDKGPIGMLRKGIGACRTMLSVRTGP